MFRGDAFAEGREAPHPGLDPAAGGGIRSGVSGTPSHGGHILTNLANTNDIGASNTIFKTLYVNKVTELSEPMNNTDAATKLYVDSLMNQVQTESDIQTANINKLQMNINNLRHLLVQQWQQVINPV